MDLSAGPVGAFLLGTAVWAGHELGVYEALGDAPRTAAQVAARLGVGAGRLGALLDVLCLAGVRRVPGGFVRGEVPARPPPPPAQGWGRMAEVIRRDRPLDEPIDLTSYHTHLVSDGEAAARALAARLPGGSLLDLGGGAGVYTRAWLDAHPGARATLVDAPEVLPFARALLGDRAALVAGDARDVDVEPHDVALVSNVLHHHGPDACRAIVARAAALARRVVLVDLRIDEDRGGPPGALLFALSMALYTEGGTVYTEAELASFLGGEVTSFALGDELLAVTAIRR